MFVDEGIEYAQRLSRVGVPTELLVVPGTFIGFDMFASDTRIARRFATARLDSLRRAMTGQF